MNRVNHLLVTDEPVESGKQPVEVEGFMIIIDHFRGIHRIFPLFTKKKQKISTCNQLDLETLGS